MVDVPAGEDEQAAGLPTGGPGPVSLFLVALVVLVAALVARWAQDVAAPWVNEGEADLAETIDFDADGGRYRVVTSGPVRPILQQTVCEIRSADGEVEERSGVEGVGGATVRFSVTRVLDFSVAEGPAEVRCGQSRPDGGAGNGRYQIVDADGIVSRAVTIALAAGSALLVLSLAWFAVRSVRSSGGRPAAPPV